ncbi:hypothetical protein CHCC20441_2110 [Bacillus licheniformis]|jgi:hypothetical protein|uniref:Uncharacterized protein n=1 Tax=Bacillus licheniformis TaxID=1402 RepID=A0A8B5YGG8_BACLI|nr:hypothetical protein N399_19490 [Bacillus licheniformis CG-B52]KUL12103.1 hypothetical protein LI17339_07570 [Bacillus licheniformis LMG 17339]KYC72554.1 hypothetical protein B4092_3833 [Bacillus licheniformis]KYC80311.1 hypothetical protein B4090_3648 [Bacillus licheniformis]KYC84624.1 hypothetical protein B4091_3954 [Bacillus licheniformis]
MGRFQANILEKPELSHKVQMLFNLMSDKAFVRHHDHLLYFHSAFISE